MRPPTIIGQTHNWSYYNLHAKDVTCFLWHEGNGSLESDIFSSIATQFIKAEIENFLHSKLLFGVMGAATKIVMLN